MATIGNRFAHAWNAFRSKEDAQNDFYVEQTYTSCASQNPVPTRLSGRNERSILTTVINRIAMDVASFDIQHVKVDDEGRYLETVNDSLNQCLTVEANKDQTGRAFIQDVVMSMFDEGHVVLLPVETSISPNLTSGFNIYSMRTGRVVDWYPSYVRIEAYNELVGRRERILVPKNMVAIIENPLYAIMNEPNSTFKRLIRKLNLLDTVDEASSSGKLDLIIQLPYTVRSEARQLQAEERLKNIERQLTGKKYGIAYADSAEHITQLNRPIENNLLTQIQYLTTQFYSQLGMGEDVFNGKASELVMRNYYDRTVEPIVTAIIEETKRKFLTKTARSQGHSIMGFRDTFRLVPAGELAEIVDVFSRNEILTGNEVRQIIGRKPSDNPRANELQNKNMPTAPTVSSDITKITKQEEIDNAQNENED